MSNSLFHRPRALGSALALTLALVAAGAAEEFTGDGLCRFLPVKYVVTPTTEAMINTVVGKSLQQHQEVFGFTTRPDFHVRIRIFGQYKDYESYSLKNRASAQHRMSVTNVAGWYSPRKREVVTWRQRNPGYLANNLLHEASHAILLAHYKRVPNWIGEGCAVYFSFPTMLQDSNDIDALKYRWAKLNLWLRENQLPDLKAFLNQDHGEWNQQDVHMAYTASWSLFQHLMRTEQNKQVLQRLMLDLQKQNGPRPICTDAIDRHYPGGLQQFEKDWHRWIEVGGSRVLGPDLEDLIRRVK